MQLSFTTRPLTVGRAHQTEAFEALIPAVAPENFRRPVITRKSGVTKTSPYKASQTSFLFWGTSCQNFSGYYSPDSSTTTA